MRKTQFDTMIEQIKEIFGDKAGIYSTNYYNPGRRYQVEIRREHGGASIFGKNMIKKSFKEMIEKTQEVIYLKSVYGDKMTQEELIDFWIKESNKNYYK